MQFNVTRLLIIFSMLSLSSCVNLAKRYKGEERFRWINQAHVPTFVTVGVNSYNIKELAKTATSQTIYNLSSKAQAELINSVNGHSNITAPDSLIKYIGKDIISPKEAKPKVKIISPYINKSIVFSVDRQWYANNPVNPAARLFNHLGDRIAFLELDVSFAAAQPLEFNSWEKFVTEYATVDLGKVTSAQQWAATASIGAKNTIEASTGSSSATESITSNKKGSTSSDVGENFAQLKDNTGLTSAAKNVSELSPNASLNFTDKYETSVNLSNRILKLSGSLETNRIVLKQEGSTGIDLSGNIVLSVEYKFTGPFAAPLMVYKFQNYYTGPTASNLAQLARERTLLIYPDINADITGNLRYKFLYRQIRRGKRHIPEARNKVTLRYGEKGYVAPDVPVPTTLIRQNDLRPVTYRIWNTVTDLTLMGPALNFETSIDAANFLEWLRSATDQGRNTTGLAIGGVNITPGNISTLAIRPFQN